MNNNIISLFKNLSLSKIAKDTSNTLNVVKKIIPIYKEVRPYFNHEKSIFVDNKKTSDIINSNNNTSYNDNLTFFN